MEDAGGVHQALKGQGYPRQPEHCLQGRDRSRACGGRPASRDRWPRHELRLGDKLLEALVACAYVTLKAVATVIDIPLKSVVLAEGGS